MGLLEDTDPGVRRAAITAAAQLRHPRLIAPLVVALEDSSQRADAESALVAIGRDALPQVLDAFTGAREEGEQIRLLRLAVRLGGEAAEGLLMSCVAAPSRKLREVFEEFSDVEDLHEYINKAFLDYKKN